MSKCVKCGNEILTGDIHWEMGLCNNCYNELYKDHKTHISLDKMWLKLAQDFRDENEKLQDKVADLEAKLAESEKELNRYAELFGMKDKDFYVVEKTEYEKMKQGAKDIVMQLKQQLAEKDIAIENWQTMYESVVQTCHNDKEEIERLNKQLETQEKTITNIVEDNRASQEWYKKQLEEKEKERHEEWKTGKEWKWEWQKVNQKLEKAEQDKISFAVEQLEKARKLIDELLDNCGDKQYKVWEVFDNQIKQLKEMK